MKKLYLMFLAVFCILFQSDVFAFDKNADKAINLVGHIEQTSCSLYPFMLSDIEIETLQKMGETMGVEIKVKQHESTYEPSRNDYIIKYFPEVSRSAYVTCIGNYPVIYAVQGNKLIQNELNIYVLKPDGTKKGYVTTLSSIFATYDGLIKNFGSAADKEDLGKIHSVFSRYVAISKKAKKVLKKCEQVTLKLKKPCPPQ